MEEQKLEELQKCTNSPYYFFTNYLTINGERAWTILTEEEFNLVFNQLVNNGNK